MKSPISLIIPCYNGEKYIHETLQSIEDQDWPFEIIFIDDGSTDNSASIIKKAYPNSIYYYQTNSSPAAARNKGISLASHEILGFLDVDDKWTKDKTRLQMETFEKDPQLEIVGGLINHQIMPESEYRSSFYSKEAMEHSLISSILIRKSVFDKVGYFDESLRLGEDLDWFLRVKENRINYHVIDSSVLHYRIHENGITAGKNFKGLGTTEVIRRALERKRNK